MASAVVVKAELGNFFQFIRQQVIDDFHRHSQWVRTKPAIYFEVLSNIRRYFASGIN